MRRVVVVPAGRKACLQLLLSHLRQQRSSFDRLDLWVNTKDPKDLEYIFSLAAESFVRLVRFRPTRFACAEGSMEALGYFWRHAVSDDTVYVRLDDDIVWLEPNALEKIFSFRLQNRDAWLTGPLVINNAICSYWMQEAGLLQPQKHGHKLIKLSCVDDTGWASGEFATQMHYGFLELIKQQQWTRLYTQQQHVVPIGLQYSINAVSWFGPDMRAAIPLLLAHTEEKAVTEQATQLLGRGICIDGNTLVSHLSYFVQRTHPAFPIEWIWQMYSKLGG